MKCSMVCVLSLPFYLLLCIYLHNWLEEPVCPIVYLFIYLRLLTAVRFAVLENQSSIGPFDLNLITCSVYNPVLTRMGFIFYRVQRERGLSQDYPRHL